MKGAVLFAMLLCSHCLHAQQSPVDFESQRAQLQMQLDALDTEASAEQWADLERLQARQAIQSLATRKPRERIEALSLARIAVAIADAEIRSAQLRRQSQLLDRERDGILLEASRRDAEMARKEADRLRFQALAREEELALAAQQVVLADVAQNAELATEAQRKDAELARLQEEIEAQVARRGEMLSTQSKSGQAHYTLLGSAFEAGKTTLNAQARQSLLPLVKRMKASGKIWQIEGHTDSLGEAQNNREFSRLRAEAVLNALRAAGVPASRLRATGVGSEKPLASNESKAGRARNRRIEIFEK